jgi:diguanylate cyclase (GGDEF)-like protein
MRYCMDFRRTAEGIYTRTIGRQHNEYVTVTLPPLRERPLPYKLYAAISLAVAILSGLLSAVYTPYLWIPQAPQVPLVVLLGLMLALSVFHQVELPASGRGGAAGYAAAVPFYYIPATLLAAAGPAALAGFISSAAVFVYTYRKWSARVYVGINNASAELPAFLVARAAYVLLAGTMPHREGVGFIPILAACLALGAAKQLNVAVRRTASGYGDFATGLKIAFPSAYLLVVAYTALSTSLIMLTLKNATAVVLATVACSVVLNELCLLANRLRSGIRAGSVCPLTGLLSHTGFQQELKSCLGKVTTTALIMLDIDHFKKINDTLGHMEGDRVLQRVADTIRGSVSSTDIPARYGGEEFVVIVPGADLDAAVKVGERLRKAVEEKCGVTVSVGVAVGEPGAYPGALIEAADTALYRAKQGGRNRVERWPEPVRRTGTGMLTQEKEMSSWVKP